MGQLLDAYLNANHLHVALKNDVTWYSIRMLLFCGSDANKRDHYGRTPLHTAIAHRNSTEVVKLLADQASNIDAVDHYGLTALHTALRLNSPLHIIEYLLQSGADVNLEDSERNNALHMAIEFNSNCALPLIEKIMTNIKDINSQNEYGETALHLAFKYELDFNTIHYLLIKGAEPSHVNQFGSNCLHYCMLYCKNSPKLHVNLDLLLRQKSLDINAPDQAGETPLHIAVRNDMSPETIRRLYEHGSDLVLQNSTGCTPLHYVKSTEMMDILFKANKFLNVQDRRGYTVLHHMLKGTKDVPSNVVKRAIHYGCDPNVKDNNSGRTALHTLMSNAKYSENLLNTSKYLLKYIKDINMTDINGDTTLHFAIRGNVDMEVIAMLMTKGACPDRKNKQGLSAIEEFHNHKNIDFEKLFIVLEKTINVNVADKKTGFTFLHKCLKDFDLDFKNTAVTKLSTLDHLLQYGLDPNAKAKRKTEIITPLVVGFKILSDWPYNKIALHVIQLLYEHGASANLIINNRGQTAIEVLVHQFNERGIAPILDCFFLSLRAGLNLKYTNSSFILIFMKHFVLKEDWKSVAKLFRYGITVNHLEVTENDKKLLIQIVKANNNNDIYPLSLFNMAANVLRKSVWPNSYKGLEKLLLFTPGGRPYPLPEKMRRKIISSAETICSSEKNKI